VLFGKDLFNISKVIGRKKVAQFFDSQCIQRVHRITTVTALRSGTVLVCHLLNGAMSFLSSGKLQQSF